ncbi:MAG: hypothetical protein IT428_07555 [Planctomycetaceae bacterium]|nr:hypothetical protein [Planctomycetaceae bacterium]
MLIPKRGTMTARLFARASDGPNRKLYFGIIIPLEPFQFEGELQETSVRLDFIDFKVSDWHELEQKPFRFPVNPETGYIDGSVFICGVHAPADATHIRFGKLNGSILPMVIELQFDFTYEGPSKLGKPSMKWTVDLEIVPEELDAVCVQYSRHRKRISRKQDKG